MANATKKATAVVLFPHFCGYELSVLLESLALAEKPVTFFAADLRPMRNEEGMQVLADKTFADCNTADYDSLVLSGSFVEGLYINFADTALHTLIRRFAAQGSLIAAISSGPMVLCKAGILEGKRFLAGVDRQWFLDDPKTLLTAEQMRGLLDMPIIQSMRQRGEEPDYLLDGNILTAGGWKFREWALAFCRTLGLPVSPSAFGSDLQ